MNAINWSICSNLSRICRLFFKYINVLLQSASEFGDNDFDYTPCDELLSATWCEWKLREVDVNQACSSMSK